MTSISYYRISSYTVEFKKRISLFIPKCITLHMSNRFFHTDNRNATITYSHIAKMADLYNKELTPIQLMDTAKAYSKDNTSKVDLTLYNRLSGLDRQSDRVEIEDLLIILQSLANLNIREYNEFSFCSELIKRKLNKMYNTKLENGQNKYTVDRDSLFAIFNVFTHMKLLHYPLFQLLSELYLPFVKASSWQELDIIVHCLALQKNRNAPLLDHIRNLILSTKDKIATDVASRLLYNFSMLSKVDDALLNSLEAQIYGVDIKNEANIEKISLDYISAVLVLYSYLLNKIINYPLITRLLALQADFLQNLKDKALGAEDLAHSRRLYFIRSYLRVLHYEYYRNMHMEIRVLLRNLSLLDLNKTSGKERIFPQKVSWHLTKMRIAHSISLLRGGVELDIVERDKRVVWQCNSYHRFYANSFQLTSQVELEQELIRALGYSIVNIQYYQWNRMMIKDTRFAYLRMARYYALEDHREFDKSLLGWNLPYLWKNNKRSKFMADVSYSYKYQPLSHAPYT